MIYSMTGYAARTLDVERGALHIELKSVKSRFLDFQFRICEDLRAIEPALRELFSAVVTADDVENHKPAPDTFLLCAERMGIAPERCVVFEDADFGLQAARRAGMDAVDVRLL